MKLDAKKLRESAPTDAQLKKIKRNPIYFVLDEILDTYNIGSMFRLADAVAAQKMYLCGDMQTPPYHRIHKAAVGTEMWVPWIAKKNALEAIGELKEMGVFTVAVEQHANSIPFKEFEPKFPIAIVVGHETHGVSEEALNAVDEIVELPMLGVNKSFNVWGTAAVVAYYSVKNLIE